MKTITNTNTGSKKLLVLLSCLFLMGTSAFAQFMCNASFTYTVGSNGQVSFTNTSTGLGTSPTYQWNFGDNTYDNSASPSHTYAYNGGYHITLYIDSANGGSSCTFTDSITITNAPLTCNLSAAFTYTNGSNGQVSFTDASTGVDPGMGYSWTFTKWPSGAYVGSSGQQSPTFTFNYNGTYQVQMSVGDANHVCYQTVTQYVTITNGQACQVSFTYTVGSNGQVSFTNTSQGNTNYMWSFGDGTGSNLNSPTHTYYNGTYHIYLYGDTTNGGCGGQAVDSVVITNGQNAPTCSAVFTYTNVGNGQINFTNTSTGSNFTPVYSWSFGDGNTSSATSPSHTYQYNGNYGVQLSVNDSATGNQICTSYQYITINNSPNCGDSVYYYMIKDTTQVGTWNIYLYTVFGNAITNAVWTWGDGTSSTGLTPTHTYANPGWYTICVTAYFACGDSSYFCSSDSLYRTSNQMVTMHVVNNATSVQQNQNTMTSVKAYPNPFNEDLTLNLTSYENKTITYALFDMMGNQLLSDKVNVIKGDNEFKIKTGEFGKGVYFINISGNDGKKSSTLKVVK